MEEVLQTMRELRLSRSSPSVTESGSRGDGGSGGGDGGRGSGGGSSSYVLGVDWVGERLAAASSDRRVRLFDRHTLRPLAALARHGGPVVGVRFPRRSHDLLFSASEDGTVRCWDVRLCGGSGEGSGSDPVAVFRSYGDRALASFDVNAPGSLVCAGTERSNDDAFLTFWDARGGRGASRAASGDLEPVGVYEESHSDDITQICFHPTDTERMASGGVDGLVNVFDLRQGSEEDALQATCNSHSSVAALGWCGHVAGGAGPRAGLPGNGVGLAGNGGSGGAVALPAGDFVFCATHTEGLLLWDLEQVAAETDARPLTVLSVRDVRVPEVTGGVQLDYIVGAFYHEQADVLFVAAGTHGGDLHLLTPEFDFRRHDSPPLRAVCALRGGHRATVRCLAWDGGDHGSLITGGEDGQLVLWRPPGPAEATADAAHKLPSAVHRKGRVRLAAPYKTKRK